KSRKYPVNELKAMKILYIHQYFKTPAEPGGTRSYWFAKALVQSGYKVTMLTAAANITKKQERINIEGIDVIYVKVPYSQSMGIMQRLRSFLKFIVVATRVAWRENGVDLVFATSTPLTVGIPALLLKWFRKKPYIFEVRDLWPEVP